MERQPQTPLEVSMCGLFAKNLDIESVTMTDDFFDVGGHSLLAAEVVAQIRLEFEVDLTARDFFRNPTVAHVCDLIVARHGDALAVRRS